MTKFRIEIISTVKTTGPTGVEMEALNGEYFGVNNHDMVKSLDKSITIKDLRLIFKDGANRACMKVHDII